MKARKLPPEITTYEAAHAWLVKHHGKPGLIMLQVFHDDFCPTIRTGNAADCKPPCKPEMWMKEPFASARDN